MNRAGAVVGRVVEAYRLDRYDNIEGSLTKTPSF